MRLSVSYSRLIRLSSQTPPGLHPDTSALKLLKQILSYGKNARLYKAIQDKGVVFPLLLRASRLSFSVLVLLLSLSSVCSSSFLTGEGGAERERESRRQRDALRQRERK